MSKTWYGHHIETIKGEDYVLHKDYIEIQDKLYKYKEILDKIKEYVKNNEKCVVKCSGRDFMTGMPYTEVEKDLIEKTRIEKLLEEIE